MVARTLALEQEKIAKKKATFEANAQRSFTRAAPKTIKGALSRSFTRARPQAAAAAAAMSIDGGVSAQTHGVLHRIARQTTQGLSRTLSPNLRSRPDRPRKPLSKRCYGWAGSLLGSLGFQTIMYFIFVLVFQRLANSIRVDQEFYLNQRIQDDFIDEQFDSSHNTFESIRRLPDVYEWGTNVLWPGLFGRFDPCGLFGGQASELLPNRTCNAHGFPDGEGPFHSTGNTGLTIEQLVQQMDALDWTDGIMIKQARAKLMSPCSTTVGTLEHNTPQTIGTCYPELYEYGPTAYSSESYGFNKSHPTMPLDVPFVHLTGAELGAAPSVASAAVPSMQSYETDGFVALVLPFFSETFLAEERGPVESVVDHRLRMINTTNNRVARYFCARISRNGRDVHQLCDPTDAPDGAGFSTGVVREAIEDMWADLKRGHYLDARTRVLTITMQLRNNHLGVRYHMTLMLETTSLGAVLPSYDVQTRVLSDQHFADMKVAANLSLALCLFFAVLELVEIASSGAFSDYVADLWNLMDWINFGMFALVYLKVLTLVAAAENRDCTSYMCSAMGHYDDWRAMGEARSLKQFLSLCLCMQLFKLIKFSSQLIPKMSLMSSVLRGVAVDLLFFGVVFFNCIISFSSMLFLTVGPVMADYYSQISSILSLVRALFGDFDVDEILNNTSGYMNALLFVAYLFVAVFIVLSLFLAILAEGQAAVRDDEAKKKLDPEFNEYGVVASAAKFVRAVVWRIASVVAPRRAGAYAVAQKAAAQQALADKDSEEQEEMEAARDLKYSELSRAGQNARLDYRLAKVKEEMAGMHSAVDRLRQEVTQLRKGPVARPTRPARRAASPALEHEPQPPPGWSNPLLGASDAASLGAPLVEESLPPLRTETRTRSAREVLEALEAKLSPHLNSIETRLERRLRVVQRGRPNSRPRANVAVACTASASALQRAPPATTQVV